MDDTQSETTEPQVYQSSRIDCIIKTLQETNQEVDSLISKLSEQQPNALQVLRSKLAQLQNKYKEQCVHRDQLKRSIEALNNKKLAEKDIKDAHKLSIYKYHANYIDLIIRIIYHIIYRRHGAPANHP